MCVSVSFSTYTHIIIGFLYVCVSVSFNTYTHIVIDYTMLHHVIL